MRTAGGCEPGVDWIGGPALRRPSSLATQPFGDVGRHGDAWDAGKRGEQAVTELNLAGDEKLEQGDASELLKQYHELAELAGSLAHEIKNPLSVIHMNADLLGEDINESDWPGKRRAESKIEMIRQQCHRMENLLRDFLRYSRLRDLEMTPGSLNEQIETVLRLYQAQADRDHIEIIRYLDSDLPSVMLHSDSLQASLINLVKNALEAMESGGELVVRTYSTPRGVALDLIDTGCGMDDSTALHMFEPFYSTKNGGSGLGLPTARKIIEAHGGRISVQSEVGRGTKFMLEFPTPRRLG